MEQNLYRRLGGYDGISSFLEKALVHLRNDPQLGRFWLNRSQDSLAREKQLTVLFICAAVGGPAYYIGREMKQAHEGMNISMRDWEIFSSHMLTAANEMKFSEEDIRQLAQMISSLKPDFINKAVQ